MSDLLFADLSVFLRLLSALPFGLPLAGAQMELWTH
jgi:hypothetical protein